MTDYCSVTDIKNDMPESGLSSTTDYDAALTAMITDASRLIDNEVGRWPNYFLPSSDPETRYYDGSDWEAVIRFAWRSLQMRIDDCAGVTEFAVSEGGGLASSDYTVWAAGDYLVHPYNYSALNIPIHWIEIDFINGSQRTFWGYPMGVRVKGYFGHGLTVPSPVARATKIQVIRWFMRGKQAFADSGANQITGQMTYVKKLDPDVAELIKPYMLENSA